MATQSEPYADPQEGVSILLARTTIIHIHVLIHSGTLSTPCSANLSPHLEIAAGAARLSAILTAAAPGRSIVTELTLIPLVAVASLHQRRNGRPGCEIRVYCL